MMNIQEGTMTDPSTRRPLFAMLLALLAVFGIALLAGVNAGYFEAYMEQGGGPLAPTGWALILVDVLVAGALAWWLAAYIRARRTAEPVPPRERRSNLILIGSAVAGVATAIVMIAASGADAPVRLWNGPILPGAAILLAVAWGVLAPAVTLWWLRIIDEHERDGYRLGAETAGHALLMAAPVWWLLWRGGFLPPPDIVLLIVGYAFIWSGVWAVRKYR